MRKNISVHHGQFADTELAKAVDFRCHTGERAALPGDYRIVGIGDILKINASS